jgi:DNA-binding NtrC family response regulator
MDNGYEVSSKENPLEALEMIKNKHFDIIVSDIRMPKMSGIEMLEKVKEIKPEIVVIIMTAFASVESAVEAMKLGAYDYITKPFKIEELLVRIKKAEELINIKKENQWLRSSISKNYSLDSLIGISKEVMKIKKLIQTVSNKKTTVLITGETGTGKELLTSIIHHISDRRDKPFIKVSCAILSREIFESELFGHEKGAFTGADKQRIGRFEMADEGTLYLDDIDDIPLDLQVKLLRVLQEEEFERVGSSKPIKINVRVIASTKADLQKLVKEGKFREDLYYRLNIFPIHIPPLRERKEDIPGLIFHFISMISPEREFVITDDAMNKLKLYNWYGNIRELKNITERLLLLSSNNTIDVDIIPSELSKSNTDSLHLPIGEIPLEDIIYNIEKDIIRKSLELTNGNMAKAAELLKIPSSTLRTKVYKYNIKN